MVTTGNWLYSPVLGIIGLAGLEGRLKGLLKTPKGWAWNQWW